MRTVLVSDLQYEKYQKYCAIPVRNPISFYNLPLYELSKVLYNTVYMNGEVEWMHCLKCGRETPEDTVFCQDCLLDMEKNPVDPNEVVLLPKRDSAQTPKKMPRRRTVTAEERLTQVKRRMRLLTVLLVLMTLLVAAMCYPTFQYFKRYRQRPGQNYNSVTSTTAPAETVGKAPTEVSRETVQ